MHAHLPFTGGFEIAFACWFTNLSWHTAWFEPNGLDKLNGPEDTNTSDPEDVDLSEPEDINLSDPEDVDLSEPEDVNLSDPEDVDLSDPEDVNLSDPEDVDLRVTDPDDVSPSDHEDVNISDPEDSSINDLNPRNNSSHSWCMCTSCSFHCILHIQLLKEFR